MLPPVMAPFHLMRLQRADGVCVGGREHTVTPAQADLFLMELLPASDAQAPPLPALQPSSAQFCVIKSLDKIQALSLSAFLIVRGAACLKSNAAAGTEQRAAVDSTEGSSVTRCFKATLCEVQGTCCF
jgi:hypothetical protein